MQRIRLHGHVMVSSAGEYKETKIHIHRRAIDLLVVKESEQDEVIE